MTSATGRSALLLVVLGSLLATAACTFTSRHDPFAPGVTIIIENAGAVAADIAILRDGGVERLGRVPAGEIREFLVAYRPGSMSIRADFAARRSSIRSMNARSGDTFRYRIESDRLIRTGE